MKDHENIIGILNEHTLHLAFKYLYEPDPSKQEQKVAGFVADILCGEEIIEIETRSFARLQKKLPAFLPSHRVTVVFPLITSKWIIRMDSATGKTSPIRKSPRKTHPCDVFPQLYRILPHLTNPNLTIRLHPVELLSYQTVAPKDKRGRYRKLHEESIPQSFGEPIEIHTISDYMSLVSFPADSPFTAAQFAKANHMSQRNCWYALQVLQSLGIIHYAGKSGRAFLYKKL